MDGRQIDSISAPETTSPSHGGSSFTSHYPLGFWHDAHNPISFTSGMEGRRGQRELCGKRGPSEKYKATWKNRFCLYFKALQFFVCCFRPDIGFFQFFFFYLQHGLHNKMAEGEGWPKIRLDAMRRERFVEL